MRILTILMTTFSLFWLTGCGIAQNITEGATGISNAVFQWDIRTLHLDFTTRAELNSDDNGQSSPVVIRIYQLINPKTFEAATYQDLVSNDDEVLKDSLVESKEIILKPNTTISIDVPFSKKADVVGIAAFYKEPDMKKNSWRIVLTRSDLHINKPREISASHYTLKLVDEER
ncbi:type VI secretion system lipoprotein TssJ [Orbaceae bacterium ESL0721]|nr:type VI secretion system lipoprotein TssJ [Orbaceae bacterium ESL0721]